MRPWLAFNPRLKYKISGCWFSTQVAYQCSLKYSKFLWFIMLLEAKCVQSRTDERECSFLNKIWRYERELC